MIYSASWQLLEERITDDLLVEAPAEPEINRHMQYVWGNRYIDDIVLRRQNLNFGNDAPDVTYEDTRYHLTDALFSTVVITDQAGVVAERVSYSPYGRARHHRAADLNGDGAVNSADQNILLNAWGAGFLGDLTRDGTVNSADLIILTLNWGAAEASGRLSITDNTIGFAGFVFNAEFDDAGLYTVRYRHYEPELGRWLSRDPLGYVDGMGLYEYVRGRVLKLHDPYGLSGWSAFPTRIPDQLGGVPYPPIITGPSCAEDLDKKCRGNALYEMARNRFRESCHGRQGSIRVSCANVPSRGLFCCQSWSIVIGPGESCATLAHELIHAADNCNWSAPCLDTPDGCGDRSLADSESCAWLVCSEARAFGYVTCCDPNSDWRQGGRDWKDCMAAARTVYVRQNYAACPQAGTLERVWLACQGSSSNCESNCPPIRRVPIPPPGDPWPYPWTW